MSQVTGQGLVGNLPNFSGELFTADLVQTPFLSMIGGLNGGKGKITQNFEFSTSSDYDYPAAAQPAITENQSLTAPTASQAVRTQSKNVAQIFQETINLSYEKLANSYRLSGLNTQGQVNNAQDENAFQIMWKLRKIARDVEYTCLNGVYQNSGEDADTANKTRGMIAACDMSGSAAVDASGADLSKGLMDTLFDTWFNNGALKISPLIWADSIQCKKISDIYGYEPEDRYVGGVAVKRIVTIFGDIFVAEPHKFMPSGTILLSDMAVIKPVFQPVPTKGNFFLEPLAKVGASENSQIFGKFGLDYGPAFAHGKITNLKTT